MKVVPEKHALPWRMDCGSKIAIWDASVSLIQFGANPSREAINGMMNPNQ